MAWLWFPGAALALLLALLLCPVRYRLDASRESGRFSVSGLCGLYTKSFRWEKSGAQKPGAASRREEETGVAPEAGGKGNASAPQKETAGAEKKQPPEAAAGNAERMSNGELALLAWKNGTVRLAVSALGRLIHHAGPGFFLIEGRAGLADPADTGVAAGLAYAFLPGHTRIEWVFTEKCLDLSAKAAGRIVPAYLLALAAGFAMEPPVRETMKAYREMHNA